MVKVSVSQKGSLITTLRITGHANAGPHGQDLVCAGVSSIGVGTLNALDLLVTGCCRFTMDAGLIEIIVDDLDNAVVQTILQTTLIQLSTMEQSYKKHIRINKQEV
ncbi:MAG: ribosomal-processing cysteine protease Prp [Erysipelotrichaceae bacterium]